MAPVGSRECLAAALKAGADSIYFGVEQLNMRAHSASHFTLSDLHDIAAQCREAGVKSYLTVNTIIYGSELEEAHAQMLKAQEAGADAFIIRDERICGWEDIRITAPFETDIRLSNDVDQIQYMADYLNVWCPKFYAYTPRELSFIKGTKFTQTPSQDEKYGTFEERMAEYRERGDETWIYVSCLPEQTAPYLNVMLGNDGTNPETIFWMCYRYDITGFLYWNLFYWQSNGNGNGYLRYPVTKAGPGDGILVYPGCAYGLKEPMPSMRLVGIRDGIEDYQLLTMLEAACGKEMTDDLVSHIATSVVTFNTDDDVLHNARVFLLKTLAEAK